MGNWFGKPKKKSRITEQDKAVLQLKQQRDKLKQYQKKIIAKLEKERQIAKQLLHDGKKERAKLLLRKKKYMEQTLSKTDVQLMNLEQMVSDIEFAQVEMQVINGLKIGNESLKQLNEMLAIEDVEKILEETQEAAEKQQEITALLSGNLTDEDEEGILEELDAIIAETIPAPITDKVGEEDEMAVSEENELPEKKPSKQPSKVPKTRQAQLVAAT